MATALFYLVTWFLAVVVAGKADDISKTGLDHGTNMLTATKTTKPGCPRKCGNLTIPYPFGIGPKCSLNPFYSLTCNSNFSPPKAFLINPKISTITENPRSVHEITGISETQLRIRNMVLHNCFVPVNYVNRSIEQGMSLPPDSPFVFSVKSNKIIVVGCGFYTKYFTGEEHKAIDMSSSYCTSKEAVSPGDCVGSNGCKQDLIPKVVREFYLFVSRPRPDSIPYDRCGYSFIGESNAFEFKGLSDFDDHTVFVERTLETVPLVVDWVIGNETCKEARKSAETYGCHQNTSCVDRDSGIQGYSCQCLPGYEGNPYLPPGCTEIIECPVGYEVDGSGCVLKLSLKLTLGLGVSLLAIAIGITWIYWMIRKRRSIKMKEKMFTKNGGLFLEKQLSSIGEGGSEPVKIFTEQELKIATRNFREDYIAGRGGSGIVYKGILKDKGFIAIKKAIIIGDNQIEQFINELVILSQINHKNVVKLLGCCLEVEVPLLIYEFIPNGALFNHIHNGVHGSWLDWHHCLRIISEIADALAYLHSATNCPVIHRDIKSANILLDQQYTAKISDFGGSRVIPMDQTKWYTAVQGTLGYLDPEYLFSSELTEKSDVYSFGVLVAELLTRKKAVYPVSGSEFRNLATDFVESIGKGQVLSILDIKLTKEAPIEEVMFVVEVVGECLKAKGEDRPTMKDVSTQLNMLASRVLADNKYG